MGAKESIIITDTHCHLDFHAFDADRVEVLDRARHSGIARILNPGVDLISSQSAVDLAGAQSEVFAAVGVHPNDASIWDINSRSRLVTLAGHPKVVAIGEIGLDYYRDRAPRELQKEIFRQQLEIAREMELPVVIHNRQAGNDLMEMLGAWYAELVENKSPLQERPGVLHSFSGGEELAWQAVSLHFYIGITGPVTFRNAPDLQRVVASLPLESLLVETDAPFLAPHPYRGQRNEPVNVRLVADKIASITNQPLSMVAEVTTANAGRLFKW